MATPSISQAATGQPTNNTKNESDHPSKKRKATSDIWDHFIKKGTGTRQGNAGVDGRQDHERYYLVMAAPGPRCADYLSSQRQTLITVKQTSKGTTLTWVFSQKASRELLTRMIIAHKHPFTLIEQPLFRAFVASSQPKFKLLSRGTLKTDIIALYGSLKSKLAIEIAKADQILLTTDLWTLSNQTPFMVVTSHYIVDWTLKKQIIAFKELPTPHNGIDIADQLISTIMEWKLVNKVAFITVDNASSNDVVVDRVSLVLSSRSNFPPDLGGQFFHI
ncbi:hypothetical protein MJO28_016223 [Puccinia striiformis f. sp. tritici]|uniref:Uncharacterized protein n=1 Tax=Puccinia striiformis f. sp. tritici TaxID=168172 RepID=A0ACC0DMQ5_9BASI|nr:hypothetical protein MJO28_016223 [Puccinia striiformis f. sp. tritici]